MNMLENIRRIGIFMIAAQTVMHFAAGKQYEKYMKIVTGVIVLLLFIGPFTASSENPSVDWQAEFEQMERRMQSNLQQEFSYTVNSIETVALRQIEQEIKERLNDTITDKDCSVTDVVIDLDEIAGNYDAGSSQKMRNWVFQRVRVTLQGVGSLESPDGNGDMVIRVEEIRVGHDLEDERERQEKQNLDQDAKIQEYQQLFAQTLGIDDDRVEVIYRGGW